MSVPPLVEAFYSRIWNAGDESAVGDLLTGDFAFRGSLGISTRGHHEFLEYVRSVRASLSNYYCAILSCVAEGLQACARMEFGGVHEAPLRGFAPTGKAVEWEGAALFTFRDGKIAALWVLGDLASLDERLRQNAVAYAAGTAGPTGGNI
ncbi:MAG: ester cyclase [Acidobacteria bacterium]|nr:ester cyclase [Acidobacteriota bacterium]